mmetsp:Transcript_1649/g.4122  ORF Transcript_1649/g.4122 Transcript_1649/m.4122 type:complete len:337 (+) Transcript_1649:305-1315(+)
MVDKSPVGLKGFLVCEDFDVEPNARGRRTRRRRAGRQRKKKKRRGDLFYLHEVVDLVNNRRWEKDVPVGEGAAVEAPSCTEGDISIHEESAFHGTARSNRHISTHLPHNVGRNHTSDQVDFDVGGHRKVAHDAYDENVGRSALQEDIPIDVDMRVPLVGALCEGESADGRRAAVGFRRERGRPRRDVGVGRIERGEGSLQTGVGRRRGDRAVLVGFAVPFVRCPRKCNRAGSADGTRQFAIRARYVVRRREDGEVACVAEVDSPLLHRHRREGQREQHEEHCCPLASLRKHLRKQHVPCSASRQSPPPPNTLVPLRVSGAAALALSNLVPLLPPLL